MIYGYSIGILYQFHEREKGNILQIHLDTKAGFLHTYICAQTTVDVVNSAVAGIVLY